MTPRFGIKRVSYRSDGTFGVFLEIVEGDGAIPFATTCEEVWRDNLPEVSCIPTGTFLCKRVDSPHFGNTFEITGVPGRSHVLFHWGNTIKDTRGCVLSGETFTMIDGLVAVGTSRSAPGQGFNEFIDRTKHFDEFTLEVTDVG